MIGSLRKSGEWKRCCGIYFTFIPPCRSLGLLPLKAFDLMLFNLVGFQFVNQMGWITMRGVESNFEEILPLFILRWPLTMVEMFSFILINILKKL